MNYVQLLNRLLCSADGRVVFVPKDANGGSPQKIVSALKREKRQNRNICIWIFLDEDLYQRNPDFRMVLEEKKGAAVVKFSRMNFEDAVMLHEPYGKLKEWIETCREARHFSSPLPEEEYLPLFKQYFPDYHKRELPFELTDARLDQAFKNLKNQSDIRCSLLSAVEELLQTKEIVRRYRPG